MTPTPPPPAGGDRLCQKEISMSASDVTMELPPVPVIGGPRDGSEHKVEILFPFLNGGIPASGWIVDGHLYELAADRESWRYVGVWNG
jgi:hypothetical protein